MLIRKKFDDKELKDSGLALSLILALAGYFTENPVYITALIPVLLITMTVLKIIYPFAFIWYNFSGIMGTVMSKVILSIIFFIVVTPTALIKKMTGYDPMRIKPFKKSVESVFVTRDHSYIKTDMEKTY